MAQRRLRALGMLGALGATDRHVRLVMVANGALVGVVGALAGSALGIGLWFALAPRVTTLIGHRVDRFALPWWAIAAAVLLAVVTAVAAAWWPARAAARLSIVAALSGRPPPPQPAHRFAALAVVLLAAGPGLLGIGPPAPTGVHRRRHRRHDRRRPVARPAGHPGTGPGRWHLPRSVCDWRCATWPATRPAPGPRWAPSPSPSASPRPSRSTRQSWPPSTDAATGGNLPDNQLVVYLSGEWQRGSGARADTDPAADRASPSEHHRECRRLPRRTHP